MTDDVKIADIEIIAARVRFLAMNIKNIISYTREVLKESHLGSDHIRYINKCQGHLIDALKEAAAFYFELKNME